MSQNKKILKMVIAVAILLSVSLTGDVLHGQAVEKRLPKVHIAVSQQQVNVGDTFEVAIWLQNFTGEYGGIEGFEVRMKYDPELIVPVGDNKFNLGAIFPTSSQPWTMANQIDVKGEISLAQNLPPQSKSGHFGGYGKLGTITFKAVKEGQATLKREKSLIIMPGNVGINIKHEMNQPVVVIGAGSIVKDDVISDGKQPDNKQAVKSTEDILKGYKDVNDFANISWAKEAAAKLSSLKIVNGTPEGNFLPLKNMTRAEFAKVAVIGLGLDMKQVSKPTFADIKKSDWFYDYVETAAAYGLINGIVKNDQRVFNPNANISRAEIAAILSRALIEVKGKSSMSVQSIHNPFTDISESHWANNSILYLYQAGIIKGKSEMTFAPGDNATRAEISVMISRLLDMQ